MIDTSLNYYFSHMVVSGFQTEPYNPEAPDVSRYKFSDEDEASRDAENDPLPYQPQSRSSLVSVPTIPNEKEGIDIRIAF